MKDQNNRLFHYTGFKDVLWLPEQDIKNYPDFHSVHYAPGEKFLVQHAIHGCWSMGVYYPTNMRGVLGVHWIQVIIINKE